MLRPKVTMNKIKNENYTQMTRWDNMYLRCIQECAPVMFCNSTNLARLFIYLKNVLLYCI